MDVLEAAYFVRETCFGNKYILFHNKRNVGILL